MTDLTYLIPKIKKRLQESGIGSYRMGWLAAPRSRKSWKFRNIQKQFEDKLIANITKNYTRREALTIDKEIKDAIKGVYNYVYDAMFCAEREEFTFIPNRGFFGLGKLGKIVYNTLEEIDLYELDYHQFPYDKEDAKAYAVPIKNSVQSIVYEIHDAVREELQSKSIERSALELGGRYDLDDE